MKVFKTALLGIVLCCLAQTSGASEIFHRDTVSINGQIISIRADVEIDSLLMRSGSWIDDLDAGILLRMGTNFRPSMTESYESYFQSSYIRFPELALEFNHPFFWSKSKQINYRAGVSVGASSRFITDELEGNVIGFHVDGNDVGQIVLVPDPLQNESDTISVSKALSPQFKINAGFEWHGIMRAARGWRLGLDVVFTPLRNQYVQYNKLLIDNPVLWEGIDPSSTYSIDETQFSRFDIKFFYSWSPWNSQFFFRNSWVWSPNNLQTAFTLGYHL
jgi:hypothetical protein